MTHRFSGAAAAAYDSGRAAYLPGVVAAMELPTPPSRVLDLAAGTGLLSRALLAAGHAVVAVEPDLEMAAQQPAEVERVTAPAEATGLPEASVDAVAVGDAWHWFDPEAVADEVHRVLRPRGRLAIVWRYSVADDRPAELAPFYARLQEVREAAPPRGATPAAVRDADLLAGHPGFAPLVHLLVPFVHRTTLEGLLAEAASASSVNALTAPDREALLGELREELTRAGVGPVEVPYVADVWRTARRR